MIPKFIIHLTAPGTLRRRRRLGMLAFITLLIAVCPQAARADDTALFGDQRVFSNVESTVGGQAEAFSFSGADGTAHGIHVYVDASSTATKLTIGLYRAAPDLEGAPLIASGSLSNPVAGAWNTVAIPATLVSSSDVYWAAILGTGGTLSFRDDSPGLCVADTSSQSDLSSLPATFSIGSARFACPASAYVSGSTTQLPVNTSRPTVTGTATEGQSLTTTTGAWNNTPTSYSYQWQRCNSTGNNCSDIAGATNPTYTLQTTDLASTIRSTVTATNPGGSATATSVQTATAAGVVSALPGSPASTAVGVSVGLPATTSIGGCCGGLLTSSPPVSAVWNWNNGTPSLYPSIYKGEYFPAYDQPDTRYVANTEPLSWFESNHPDWLEFKCSGSSVSESTAIANGDLAYISGNPYDIPLDLANPSVLSWLESTVWGPIAASGAYQHLDFDNFAESNGGGWTGQQCGHYSSSGTWVAQYSATNDDANWRAFQTSLAANIQSWLHANYPNVAFAANLTWCDCYLSDEQNLLSHVDLWFDEQGFTNGNNGGGGYANSAWSDKAAAVQAVVGAGHGWMDINQEPVSLANTTQTQRQWALGNYLLLKNNASWIYICGNQEYGTLLIAPEYAAAQVGTPTGTYYQNQGVYRRDFTNGLVLVNPSSTTTYTITIPANTYKDLYGNPQPTTITLPPSTAVTLVTSSTSTYASSILGTSGLSHYYRFGEASGTTATDSKGSSDGSYLGGFLLGQPGALSGDSDTSVSLDGSTGRVSAPINPGGAQGTIEFWGYATDLSSRNGVVYTAGDGSTSYSHQIGVRSDGSVRLYLWDGSARTVDTVPGLVAPNQWHYYALTWADNGSAILYVDGVNRGSISINSSWKGGNKLLFGAAGGSASGLTNSWQGRIDEGAVYNTALSATTIQQHYNAGT